MTVVDFAFQSHAYREFIQNLSGSSAYIETSGGFSVGQEITLTFSFSGPQTHVQIIGSITKFDGQSHQERKINGFIKRT
jgi:hypothetical protein